jgi:hypothetical protein
MRQARAVQIMTAVHIPEVGPAGIGITTANAPANAVSRIYDQSYGSAEYLELRAILRALQLGRSLRARSVSILCPDEMIARIANRDVHLEPGSPLAPIYMKVRALMYTFKLAEIRAVPKSRVEAARRLAIAASRIPAQKPQPQRTLFAA